MGNYPRLFAPLSLRHTTLRNRIVMPPMVTMMAPDSAQASCWYAARAEGGAGLIIREATSVDLFQDPRFADGLRATVEAVHAAGAAIAIQLFQRSETPSGELLAPSEGPHGREVTDQELGEIVRRFAQAASEAERVGFDGVEPHGAHGFFLNQFLSPASNRRLDFYGGSLEKRMRLGLEIVAAVRETVSEGLLLLYRHTAVGERYGLDDSIEFARRLERAGVDVLDISPSTSDAEAPHADLAGAIKAAVSIPVIAVGGMQDPEAAEAVLHAGRADLVAIGRGLIADPCLPLRMQEGRTDQAIACVQCNELCFGNLQQGIPIGCAQNPASGHEFEQRR